MRDVLKLIYEIELLTIRGTMKKLTVQNDQTMEGPLIHISGKLAPF